MSSASRQRRLWTQGEDMILKREAEIQLSQGALRDWNGMASKLPGRTNKDCRKRWNKVCKDIRKGAWTEAEDQLLRDAVDQYGYRWTQVAQAVGSRHADQCAKRWQHSLDPALDHSMWIPEDDERLIEAVSMYGRNWRTISEKEFPLRSPTDLKNRHVVLDRRRRQASQASEKTSPTILPQRPAQIPTPPSEESCSTRLELLKSGFDDSLLNLDDSLLSLDDMCLSLDVSRDQTPSTPSTSIDPYSISANHSDAGLPSQLFDNQLLPDDSDSFFKDIGITPGDDLFSSTISTQTHPPANDYFGLELDPSLDFSTPLFGEEAGSMPSQRAISHKRRFSEYEPASPSPSDSGSEDSGKRRRNGVAGLKPTWPMSTLILEDVRPEMVNGIMETLFRSGSSVKMKVFSQ